ncbi:MAG TPA: hypothetical protein VLA96_09990 [Terriglobales bacterium]|nr:hypothetical protein [Terriglobales bacterium]
MKRVVNCVFLLIPIIGLAQQPSSEPFFRYQRVYETESVCLLLRGDGAVRWEKQDGLNFAAREGTIAPEQLQQVIKLLSDPRIAKLEQREIVTEMVISYTEAVQLAIDRGDHWQELTFGTPKTVKAHKQALEPIVRWVSEIAKRNLVASANQTATKCLPQPKTVEPRLATTAAAATPDRAPAPVRPWRRPFLVRYSRDYFYRTHERDCAVIFPDGHFRMEHRTQHRADDEPSAKVYEGDVPPSAMEQLRGLLEAPGLVQATSPETTPNVWMREGEIVTADIPRANGPQNLEFHRYFGVVAPGKKSEEPGGKAGIKYEIAAPKVLDPLREWIKHHVQEHKGKPLADHTGNNCFPEEPKP